jgi:diguanylate cyclase (GGDEF)-like protein
MSFTETLVWNRNITKENRRLFSSALSLLLFLLCNGIPAQALDPTKAITQYAHQRWDMQQGLPENSVQTILQTTDGYLWIGTEEGLARFDGADFTVFDRQNTPAFINNSVKALAEGPDGSLWIGTTKGLLRLKQGLFLTYTTRDGLPNNYIRALEFDRDGTLWIFTLGAGVTLWKDEKFSRSSVTAQDSDSLGPKILCDADGSLWVATNAGVLWSKNGNRRLYTAADGLSSNGVALVFRDRGGTLWAGTDSGLDQFTRGKFRHFALSKTNSKIGITSLLEDREGNFWVGTALNGLFRVSGGQATNLNATNGLANDQVQALYEDRQGDIWVGTEDGLEELSEGAVIPWGAPEGLSEPTTWSIAETKNGSIWVGADHGKLYELLDGSVTRSRRPRSSQARSISSVYAAEDGTLWIGGAELLRFKDGKSLPPAVAALRNERPGPVYENSGALWIGTENGVFRLVRAKATHWTTRDGLAGNVVWAIAGDLKGGTWIATTTGLSHFSEGRFRNYTTADGLSDDLITALYEDGDGVLWIGTASGLNRFKDGKFTVITDRDGLFNNAQWSILEDNGGYLWLSCNKGIFRVKKAELNDFAAGKIPRVNSESYGTEDGMRSVECNGGGWSPGLKDHRGHLWFPTMAGVVEIDPRRLPTNVMPLQPRISSVAADGKSIDLVPEPRIPLGTHQLDFHYTAPTFIGVGRVLFKYRLEGLDHDWVYAGTRRVAYYANVPPGGYRFRVIASNADGVWSGEGASVDFYLMPHFYQTEWFYGLFTLCVLGLVFTLYRLRIRSLRSRQKELELRVMERTQELQREVFERKRAEEALRHQAYYDALTGLPNRILLRDTLAKALADARRRREKVALLFLDLDRFKTINDSLGHSVGDLLLKEVAERLKKWARAQDTVARLGGDEFVLVLSAQRDIADAAVAVDRLMQAMTTEIVVQDHILSVTCSVGVSVFPDDGTDGETLLKNADSAMYCAKDNGRNRFQFFTPDMNRRAVERLTLENNLCQALERGELFLEYQPQVDLATGMMTGAEALLRWFHPELGLVSPAKFIPIAENSGLIIGIGEWVLRTACAQAGQWQDEGLPALPVAVNVSAVQFRQDSFLQVIEKVLQETGLLPQYLELELTEGLLLSNGDGILSLLRKLRDRGVKLSIDDFGTGYSSLSYLRNFPVYKLKIDRSFVQAMTVDSDSAAITTTIINMAKSLNLKAIAEGVESEEQIIFLRANKCDEVQGYYFSRPLSAAEFAKKLRSNRFLRSLAPSAEAALSPIPQH